MELKKLTQLNIKKQQGVVLIVSLVFLIALTAVAAALMQNTTSDMKMSGASEELVVATQETISAIDEAIYRQVNAPTNEFASPLVKIPSVNILGTLSNPKGKISAASLAISNNEYELEPDCPHSRSASSTQVFTCNVLLLQVTRKYGRNDTSQMQANSGIAQQLLRQ